MERMREEELAAYLEMCIPFYERFHALSGPLIRFLPLDTLIASPLIIFHVESAFFFSFFF
jgi:hypothetical protein